MEVYSILTAIFIITLIKLIWKERQKMSNLQIINQLLNGNHLSKKELKKAKKIIEYLNIELNERKV